MSGAENPTCLGETIKLQSTLVGKARRKRLLRDLGLDDSRIQNKDVCRERGVRMLIRLMCLAAESSGRL